MEKKKNEYYLETYLVNGSKYGIEDYKQKGVDHFMPETCAKNGRFHLWCSGCGIGYENNLQDARFALLEYIHKNTTGERDDLVERLGKIAQVITTLETTLNPLSAWKVVNKGEK